MRQFGRVSALALLFALAATGTRAAEPSFDCAKAKSSAAKLVCADNQLAALDRETARLYALALNSPQVSGERKKLLKAYQRGWIKGRDDCWKANDRKQCVRDSYAMRIYELRQGYADARGDDAKGISKGPLALECDGFDTGIGVSFIASEPLVAAVAWKDRKLGLESVPSGSGAKYAGNSFDGEYVLWTKGEDATFEMRGKQGLQCRIGPGG